MNIQWGTALFQIAVLSKIIGILLVISLVGFLIFRALMKR